MDQQSAEIIGTLFGGVFGIIYLVIIIAVVVAQWKIFEKAGKPGWASIIPIYNLIVFLEIINRPIWWIVFFLIPVVNIIFALVFLVISGLDLAKVFGKDTGFAIGLILLPVVFYMILGFSDAQYQGAGGAKSYDDGILDRG
ncbi:DUF5684 domain-containing protein [Bernardetia sp.]|uniref:DUF5684 domain-containing protein n=1 Tax=Bernardetia sp. TaxID=1937974 RepID=UPI0025B83C9E|nr:DUF5684 domain-containing protein [Bernardetia sp.]